LFRGFGKIKDNFLNGVKEKFNVIFAKNLEFSKEIQAKSLNFDEALLENQRLSEEIKKNQRKINEFQDFNTENNKTIVKSFFLLIFILNYRMS